MNWRSLRREASTLGPVDAAERVLSVTGSLRAPVPVLDLIGSLGIHLNPVFDTKWSGAVNSNANGAVIWYRMTDAPVRQRFTLAHELGHLLLHGEGVAFRDDTFSGGPREVEANVFAAHLLMPRALLTPMFRGRDTKSLARTFHVSEQAMAYQLHHLFNVPLPYSYA